MKMNQHLILHHLKKDIHNLKFPLFLWIILLVTSNLFFLIICRGGSEGTGEGASAFFTFFFLLEPVLIAVIIGLVIQDDPLVGSTASWFTRPISPKMLFTSKLMFMLIFFLALPLVFEITVMIFQGVLVQHIFGAAIALIIGKLAFMMPLMIAAALTLNYTLYILLGVLPFFAAVMLYIFSNFSVFFSYGSSTLQQSRSLVGFLLTIAVGFAILRHQFLTRKTARSVVYTALGIILLTATFLLWKWDFWHRPVPVLPENDPLVQDVFLYTYPYCGGRGDSSIEQSHMNYYCTIECFGVPDGFGLHLYALTDITITPANGSKESAIDLPVQEFIPGRDYGSSSYYNHPGHFFSHQADTKYYTAKKLYPSRQYYKGGELRAAIIRLPREMAPHRVSSPYLYFANATFDLFQCRTYAELPLATTHRYKEGSDSIRILGIQEQGDGYRVKMKIQSIGLGFDGLNKKPGTLLDEWSHKSRMGFILHNKKSKEVVLAGSSRSSSIYLYPLHIDFIDVYFPGSGVMDNQWLRDAELVCFKVVIPGRFTKPLVIENIHIPGVLEGPFDNRYEKVHLDLMLKRINLPALPTTLQVRQYIGKILAIHLKKVENKDDKDPRIEKLAEVGPGHIALLAELGTRFHDRSKYYASRAIHRLAGPEHKELILRLLSTYPELIDTAERQGWTEAARKIVLEQLKQHPGEFTERTKEENKIERRE